MFILEEILQKKREIELELIAQGRIEPRKSLLIFSKKYESNRLNKLCDLSLEYRELCEYEERIKVLRDNKNIEKYNSKLSE